MSQLEQLFSQALGISAPWKITALRFDPTTKNLDIDVDFERGSTFVYEDPETEEKQAYKVYDTVQKTWRHLNFFEHTCYLHARVPRIQPHQGGTKMILPPWSGVVAGFTLLFESFAMQICRSMPAHQAAKILQTTDHKLWHMMDGYVSKALAIQDLSDLTSVGADETSVAKGHEYISLFVDLIKKKTVFITEGKDHKTVIEFAKVLEDSGGDAKKITDISCDMSPAFIKGVHEALPNAEITFDKFHIIKIINKAVDEVRRCEVKSIPELKGARYALAKNADNLTVKQRATRERLSQMNLKSMKAVHIRENFQAIYQAESGTLFEDLLKQWYSWAIRCRLEPMVKAARTIRKHWDGILRWKISRINNGILEGFNSIIQAAKRKARGYKPKHFKTMAYLLTGKLELKIFNQHLPTHF